MQASDLIYNKRLDYSLIYLCRCNKQLCVTGQPGLIPWSETGRQTEWTPTPELIFMFLTDKLWKMILPGSDHQRHLSE